MTYKALYLRLVAAIDDALTLLEAGKIVSAIELLKKNARPRRKSTHGNRYHSRKIKPPHGGFIR